jgi:thiol-disulfide isomerase/thioredoxin
MESIAAAPNDKKRRFVLYGAAAVVAGAAGAAVGLWRHRDPSDDQGAMAPASFWDASFDSPTGGALAMRAFQGRPLLLNFWATWCPPCIDELPLIDAFYRQNSSNRWQVLGLAIDQPSAVRTFLNRMPLAFPIGLAGLEGTELGKSFGNTGGVLPFSVALSGSGAVRRRKMGRLAPADLAEWAKLG